MDKPVKNDANCQTLPVNTNFEEIFSQSPIGIFFYDKNGILTNANDSALKIARIPKLEDVLGTNIFDNPKIASKKDEIFDKGLINFQDTLDLIEIKEQNVYNPIEPKIIDIDWTVSVTDSGYLVQVQDITEQNEARINYEGLFKNKVMGFAHCKVIFNDNNEPVDFKFIDVNDTYEKYTGLKREEVIGKTITMAIPGIDQSLIDVQNNVALNGEDLRYEFYEPNLERWYEINVYSPQYGEFISIFTDISQKKETEERYNEFFNNPIVGLGICRVVVNEEGEPIDYIYLNVNDAFEEFTGLKREEIINKGVREVLPEDANNLIDVFGPVGLTGGRIKVEVPIPTLGRIYEVDAYSPSKNHFIALFTDITERKKAEEALKESVERFRTLADNIPNLAWMADAKGWIFWYNKQWYDYTGTTLEEMQGWGWQKVHHPDYVDPVTEEWSEKLLTGEPYDNIFPLKGKNGNYRWFLTRITPIRDEQGKVQRWFGTNTDVTERKNIEENLQTTLNELEQSNKELEQFAYITSHDLREPLRMITSFLQLLERRYKDQLDEDANEFIGFAVDGAKRLDTMTNDLLQYSKITSKKREIIPVNFEHVLEHALTNLKVQIEENNAIITHDPLPTIKGDEQLKIQLFQNIIGNAIKYRSQETPKIHISAIKEKNHYIFSIKDNGIGMSSKHIEKIFTIFQRLHTHDEYEGTGIGLAIAQKIVHQQGGQIWVESELGKGSTFYFTLPETQ